MKYNEIMAAIQQLKNTVANVQCEIAALEELVANENHQEETPDETPVSNVPIIEEEVEELPAPPAEVHIDIPEEEDNDAIIGCQILTKFSGFYSGQCRVLGVRLKYSSGYIGKVNPKNGKVNTKYMVYKDSVILIAKAFDGKVLGTKQVAWNSLYDWHSILRERGLLDYKKNDKWLPSTILFDLD